LLNRCGDAVKMVLKIDGTRRNAGVVVRTKEKAIQVNLKVKMVVVVAVQAVQAATVPKGQETLRIPRPRPPPPLLQVRPPLSPTHPTWNLQQKKLKLTFSTTVSGIIYLLSVHT
jgi:hypothetical protein